MNNLSTFLRPFLLLALFAIPASFAEETAKAEAPEMTPAELKAAQMKGLKDHFAEGLVDTDGNAIKLEELEGKMVGIYFSASWCGPCRAFTPVLFKHRDKYADDFQVVFVSSDRSPDAQSAYMKKNKMNCPTLKHRSDAANKLSQRYSVSGIPKLVLLDKKGEFIPVDGRGLVSLDVDFKQFNEGKTKITTEEYLCGSCDKIHTRPKIVAEDPKEQAKFSKK